MGGGGEEKFFVRSGQSPEPQAGQFQPSLEMSEEHFDFLAQGAGCLKCICFRQIANLLTRFFVQQPDDRSERCVGTFAADRAIATQRCLRMIALYPGVLVHAA